MIIYVYSAIDVDFKPKLTVLEEYISLQSALDKKKKEAFYTGVSQHLLVGLFLWISTGDFKLHSAPNSIKFAFVFALLLELSYLVVVFRDIKNKSWLIFMLGLLVVSIIISKTAKSKGASVSVCRA